MWKLQVQDRLLKVEGNSNFAFSGRNKLPMEVSSVPKRWNFRYIQIYILFIPKSYHIQNNCISLSQVLGTSCYQLSGVPVAANLWNSFHSIFFYHWNLCLQLSTYRKFGTMSSVITQLFKIKQQKEIISLAMPNKSTQPGQSTFAHLEHPPLLHSGVLSIHVFPGNAFLKLLLTDY